MRPLGSHGSAHLAALALAAAACFWPGSAAATAGFAEWEIYTPGGHLISYNDVFKAEHGTCLRSDSQPDASKAVIFASHLSRWRYYPNHVAGEDDRGFFLFDERTREIVRVDTEDGLARVLARRGLSAPETGWLTGADGWQEAWLPFMVWRPCKALLGGSVEGATPEEIAALREAALRMHSEDGCRRALAPHRLRLYRRTTWGRMCASWKASGYRSTDAPYLEAFCRELEAAAN